MISKREKAEHQFSKVTEKGKIERAKSKSRSITDADKAARDVKTAGLKKRREAREASEAEKDKGKR